MACTKFQLLRILFAALLLPSVLTQSSEEKEFKLSDLKAETTSAQLKVTTKLNPTSVQTKKQTTAPPPLGTAATEETATEASTSSKPLEIVVISAAPFVNVVGTNVTPAMYQYGGDGADVARPLFQGFCIDLLSEIAKEAGIKNYRIRLVKDGRYGAQRSNGEWDGIVGEVVRGDADLAIAPLTMTVARSRVIQFSVPFLTAGLSILLPTEESGERGEESGLLSLLALFSMETWLWLLGLYLATSLVLFVVSRLTPTEWEHRMSLMEAEEEEKLGGIGLGSLWNCLWYALGTGLLFRSTGLVPRSAGGRLAALSWWLFSSAFLLAYATALFHRLSGTLASQASIQSLEDLVHSSNLDFGFVAGGSTEKFFQNSKIPLVAEMWDSVTRSYPDTLVPNYAEGVRRVRDSKGGYAFVMESVSAEYVVSRRPCGLRQVPINIARRNFAIATSLDSPMSRVVNQALLSLLENGDVDRLRGKWWEDRSQCAQPHSSQGGKAGAKGGFKFNFQPLSCLFFLLLAGLGIALLLAMAELFLHSCRQARRRRQGFVHVLRDHFQRCLLGDSAVN